MNKDEIQKHRALLQKQLWAVADELRGIIGPDSYKDYMLGTLFYKYLSEITENKVAEFLKDDEGVTYADVWNTLEWREQLTESLKTELGFVIPPNHLYSSLVKEIERGIEGQWSVDLLQQAFRDVEASATDSNGAPSTKFQGLFEDVNLNHTGLGRTPEIRSKKIGTVITLLSKIDFKLEETELDVLGDAYEYLIGEFAASAGKKGGEFYTPQSVSKLIAHILGYEKPNFTSAYDPTCGSGSMLLRVAKETKAQKEAVHLYGQELNQTTYNAARMNMFIHNVRVENFDIANGNTLEEDMHSGIKVDVISANPPYSAKWTHTDQLEQDPRYAPYGKLAPKDKADFAFVVNIIHHLKEDGIAAVVLPHGVLFRGGAEGIIRKKLVDDNLLHAVIGLPANLFFGTSIPTAILIFKKGRKQDEEILFIDASKSFAKGKNQNHLEQGHIDRIFEVYKERQTVEKYAKSVDLKTIQENDYNLNIPRYLDPSEIEELIDLDLVSKELKIIQTSINVVESKLFSQQLFLNKIATDPILDFEKEVYEKFPEITNENQVRGKALFLNRKHGPNSLGPWIIFPKGLSNSQPWTLEGHFSEKGHRLINDNLTSLNDNNIYTTTIEELSKKGFTLKNFELDKDGSLVFYENDLRKIAE